MNKKLSVVNKRTFGSYKCLLGMLNIYEEENGYIDGPPLIVDIYIKTTRSDWSIDRTFTYLVKDVTKLSKRPQLHDWFVITD